MFRGVKVKEYCYIMTLFLSKVQSQSTDEPITLLTRTKAQLMFEVTKAFPLVPSSGQTSYSFPYAVRIYNKQGVSIFLPYKKHVLWCVISITVPLCIPMSLFCKSLVHKQQKQFTVNYKPWKCKTCYKYKHNKDSKEIKNAWVYIHTVS